MEIKPKQVFMVNNQGLCMTPETVKVVVDELVDREMAEWIKTRERL